MFSILAILISAANADGYKIQFAQFLTEPRCPKVDWYVSITQLPLGVTKPTPIKVASAMEYNTFKEVDITSQLNTLKADLGEPAYSENDNFTISFKCTNAIVQESDEKDADFAKFPAQDGFMTERLVTYGFGSVHSKTAWLSRGNPEATVFQYNILFTDKWTGSDSANCNEESKQTNCYFVNVQAQTSSNTNNDDVNLNTAADPNNMDLDPSQAGQTVCRVGTESININNNANYNRKPNVECDGNNMWYWHGDRARQTMYPLRLVGNAAGTTRASFMALFVAIFANFIIF